MATARHVIAAAVAGSMIGGALTVGGIATNYQYQIAKLDPTVKVVTNIGVGSGVYIGNGIVITAGHMVDGVEGNPPDPNSIRVIVDHDGKPGAKIKATALWYDQGYDVAALHIDTVPVDLGTATLDPDVAGIGTRIEVVGTPLGETFIHTWGRIAGVPRIAPNDLDGKPLPGAWQQVMPVNVDFTNGNSGGPAYIAGSHEVVGIVVGMHANVQIGPMGPLIFPGTVNFIVPSTVVLKLLADHAHDKAPMPLPQPVLTPDQPTVVSKK